MPWLDSLGTPIRLKQHYVTEYRWEGFFLDDVFYITGQTKRVRTIDAYKYPALTEAAATAAALAFNADPNVSAASAVRANAAGGYNCMVTYDIAGSWGPV